MSFIPRSASFDKSAACAAGKYKINFQAGWMACFLRGRIGYMAARLCLVLAISQLTTPAIYATATPVSTPLPDAPFATLETQALEITEASATDTLGQSPSSQPTGQQSPTPAQQPAPPSNVGAPAQGPAATIDTSVQGKDSRELSEEQLKKQEKQRILGIVPAFNSVYEGAVPPLTPGQKMRLMFKSTTDIYVFGFAAITAGIGQAQDSHEDYGQGVEGYAKRYAANYADTADGNFWGNAVLPIVLHEDPRYFRLGHGTITHRILYSMSTTVWCRRDDGTMGPNYANVLGNLIAGGISNVYYPAEDRGVGQTFQNAATVTAEGMIGAALIEFWPDIVHHHQAKRQAKRDAADAAARAAQQSNPPARPIQ